MYDTTQDSYTLSSSWEVDPEATHLYQEYYGSVDIWAHRALLKPSGIICTSDELCPSAELGRTEYDEFLTKFDIGHGLFEIVENTGSRLASVSLYRRSSCLAFGTSEVEILRFLAPHAARAFKLHLHFSELRARSAALETAMDALATGIIFLGPKGEVVAMNRSASALVSERDGIYVTCAGLRAERQLESNLLAKTIQQAASTSCGSGVPVGGTVLISRRTRSPLQILISPICNSAIPAISTGRLITAIAFVIDPSQQKRPAQDMLRVLFGLTPAECRVALLLSDGHAPKEIANMVGVTDNTVRSQIKSIFCKTGVKRQGELIRLLLNNSGLATRQ